MVPAGEERQALLLRAWEAVNTERHLQSVLEAVSDVLLPFVHFDSVAIVHFDGGSHKLFALHTPGNPVREGETLKEFITRAGGNSKPKPVESRPLRHFGSEEMARWIDDGEAYQCPDLMKCESWFAHEFDLAKEGVRAYCSIALRVRGKAIGTAAYSRTEPTAFTDRELALLKDAGRALAVAVSNAAANEEIARLRAQLQAENTALRAALGDREWFSGIVGESRPLWAVLNGVEEVAATEATVLITGETGTGKELVARAIHRCSPRAGGPLVKVNCGAMPATLIASELFGHERGAFTGAFERRKGRFEQAHGGTLFLDEIGELPLEVQSLLLRAIQEREFERVGGSATLRVDVRIVAATNKNLAEEVRAGRFRADLYYRLNVFPAHMPALRDRLEDIPLLVAHFAEVHGRRFKRPIGQIEPAGLDLLRGHSWPGNVRELENVVERALIMSRNGVLRIGPEMLGSEAAGVGQIEAPGDNRERSGIEAALAACRGRISGPEGAARRLGLPASTLEFRIKRLNIDKFRFRSSVPVH